MPGPVVQARYGKWVPGWLRDLLNEAQVSPAAGVEVPFSTLIKGSTPRLKNIALRAMEKALKRGEGRPAGWEPLLVDTFGGPTERQKFARAWAAVSPNTDVNTSNYESLVAHEAALRNRLPEAYSELTMRRSKIPNLERAYVTEEPLSSRYGQPGKVEAMARLLQGAEDLPDAPSLPIDVHALSGIGAQETDFYRIVPALRQARGEPYADIYRRGATIFREGLQEVAPGIPTQVSFPQYWEGVRAMKGLSPAEGVASFLRTQGLSDMRDQEALRRAIQGLR